MKIDYNKIDDIQVNLDEFIDAHDYSDAFIESCLIYDDKLKKWRDATDEELDIINEDRQFVYETVIEQLY